MSDINITVNDEIVNIDIVDEPVLVNVVNSPGVPGAPGQGVPVGGTTGQVLAKNSNTNYDTEWVDINAVPYTGATANVDLGEYELKAGQVEFDQTPTGTAGVGVMRWNDSDGTLDLGLKGGNVTLQLGQEQVARVVNKSGVNLLESAYQVVKVTDAQGQRLAVDLAQGNNDANSTDTIGIVTENIDNNQEGFITTSGIVRNINTTGSLQGETWNDGDVLYLSPTTAGAITNVKPTAPNHTVILGYVVYAHAVNGKIFVKCDNGYELGELHDVYVPTPSNNDGIFWNSTNLRYENKSVSSALGYTPANAATTLTINGVTYDLSTSRTWTISTGISGSGASGQVAYWTGASAQSGSNNLFWDAANGRLGIGTDVPSSLFEISGTIGVNLFATIYSSDAIGAGFFGRKSRGTSSTPTSILSGDNILGFGGTAYNGLAFTASKVAIFFDASENWTASNNGTQIRFANTPNGSTTRTDRLLLTNTGNLLLQNGGTFTDSGQRLQVQGTTLLNGNVTFSSATGMTWDATNSRLGIGTNTPSYTFHVSGSNAGIFLTRTAPDESFIALSNIGFTSGAQIRGFASGSGMRFTNQNGTTEWARFHVTTGNFGVGTGATDSGERLQVTGTAKITTSLDIAGGKVFSGYQSSVANDALKISASNLSAPFGVQNTNAAGFSGIEYINNSGTVQVFTGFNNNNNQEFRFNNIATGGFIDFLISSTSALRIFNNRSVSINSNTDIASAQFQITSTTRGFLPPRMTTTQKNAISSPAAGLVVYDTTLAKLCVYTTAWETITSI